MTAAYSRRGLRAAVGAVLAISLTGLLTPFAAAATPDLGGLTFLPAAGDAADPITMQSVSIAPGRGCPSTARAVYASVTGPAGSGWSGITVLTTTTAGLSSTSEMTLPMSDSFAGLAAANSLALVTGRYDVTISCLTSAVGGTAVGTFSSPVWFADATHFQSTDPAATLPTTTSMSVTPAGESPSGAPVTLAALVTGARTDGTVDFTDTVAGATVVLGSAPVAGGSATRVETGLAAGRHVLAATFRPSTTGVRGSSSTAVAHVVLSAPGAFTTSTTVSVGPAAGGSATATVVMTAAVSPATAAGTVQFTDTVAGTSVPLGSPVALTGGVATSPTTLADGPHLIGASFRPTDPAAFSASTAVPVGWTVTSGTALPRRGTLTFDPPTGAAVDPVTTSTHAVGGTNGCPTGTTFVEGAVTGPGPWTAGITVLSRTSVRTLGAEGQDFLAPLSDTFAGIAAANSIAVLPGRYDVTLTCLTGAFGQTPTSTIDGPLFFTDANHYQSVDPGTGATATSAVLTASPADRADLGRPLTLTATVAPANAAGRVQFRERIGERTVDVGQPAALVGGRSTLTSRTLTFGLHVFSAVFVPSDPRRFATSTADELVVVVARPLPPRPPKAATISGSARVGSTLTCRSVFAGATSTRTAWLRDNVLVPSATRTTYVVTGADRGHVVGCRVFATNTGGTVRRSSPALKVAR